MTRPTSNMIALQTSQGIPEACVFRTSFARSFYITNRSAPSVFLHFCCAVPRFGDEGTDVRGRSTIHRSFVGCMLRRICQGSYLYVFDHGTNHVFDQRGTSIRQSQRDMDILRRTHTPIDDETTPRVRRAFGPTGVISNIADFVRGK